MRLVSYEQEGALRAGILVDGVVVDAQAAAADLGGGDTGWSHSVRGILESEQGTRDRLAAAAAARSGEGVALAELTLGPPIPDPAKIICIGLNYMTHVAEAKALDGAPDELPADPIMFVKFATSLIGHEAEVHPPATTRKLDWEVEMAVVIGTQATKVAQADALRHVAGYMTFNDVSARDLQLASPQWTAGKAFDTSGPCGPALVTADEVPDPQALRISARLNGETMQDDTTAHMIHPVARLIEYISSLITLVPGDIIATGTPAGVGVSRDPQVFMKSGDVIEVEVEGLGVLRNTIR